MLSYEVKQLGGLGGDIAVGEVDSIVLADVDVTWTGEGGEVANVLGLVHRYIADMMTVMGDHLDGIWVIFVSWLWLQGADTFTQIVVYIITMGQACNVELLIIANQLVFWPDCDVIAFVFHDLQ